MNVIMTIAAGMLGFISIVGVGVSIQDRDDSWKKWILGCLLAITLGVWLALAATQPIAYLPPVPGQLQSSTFEGQTTYYVNYRDQGVIKTREVGQIDKEAKILVHIPKCFYYGIYFVEAPSQVKIEVLNDEVQSSKQ
jgi:hypothetical protein